MMPAALIDLVGAIGEIDRASSRSEALRAFRTTMERFGFRDFMIGGLPIPNDGRWESEIVCDGWSREWYLRYTGEDHYAHDPCAAQARSSAKPFLWHELARDTMSERARRVMDEAAEFRMMDGICVPIHTPLAGPAVVTAASERIEVPPHSLPFVETLCAHVFHALSSLNEKRAADAGTPLTSREREVLQWSALGKSAEDIASILQVSRNTVESHHRNIRNKLDAINIVHAVTKALRRQEIQI